MRTVVSTVVDEHLVKSDETEVSREGLMCESSREGEGIGKGTVVH